MPYKKTIYVSDEDMVIWKKAMKVKDKSLVQLITAGLRKMINEKKRI